MQKTYSIARSALVPSLVSGEGELVTANSRLAIIAVVGGFVGALPAIGVYKLFGAEGSLILAALVYALAAMLSWQIPRVEREQVGPDTKLEKEELHAPSIVLAGSAMGLLRGAVGFLTFFLAFGLRNNDEAPWVFGLVLVLSGVGGFLGNLLAPQLRKVAREEVILAGSLVLPAVGCLFAARSASLAMTTFGALLIAAGAAAGRVAFDSLLQRERARRNSGAQLRPVRDAVPDHVGGRRVDPGCDPARLPGPPHRLVRARHRPRLRGVVVHRRHARRSRSRSRVAAVAWSAPGRQSSAAFAPGSRDCDIRDAVHERAGSPPRAGEKSRPARNGVN